MTIGLSASLGLVNEHYISRSIQFHILIWTLNKKTVPIAYYFVIRLLFLWREEVVVLPPESMEKTYCGSVAVMSPFKFLHGLIHTSLYCANKFQLYTIYRGVRTKKKPAEKLLKWIFSDCGVNNTGIENTNFCFYFLFKYTYLYLDRSRVVWKIQFKPLSWKW